MIDLRTYYSQQLDNYNNLYTSYTTDYVKNYVSFKSDQLTYNINVRNLNTKNFELENPNNAYLVAKKNLKTLNNNYAALALEINNTFTIKSNTIDSIQKKIDKLTEENKILSAEASNLSDVNNASHPFFNNEREMYYRSIIYLITIVSGVIYILYLLQSTPFTEITKDVVVNTKNLASNAVGKAKEALGNGGENDPNAVGNSSTKNMIILLLVSVVIIAVFYLVIYLVRRAKPTAEESKTQKEIKRIADSCKRDKSESWVMGEIDKIKNYLIKPDISKNG
jgi:hypothetical protein